MKCPTNQRDIAHLTLGMLLHYLGKLKIQILTDECPEKKWTKRAAI